jgi:hypothetical protein
MQNFRITTIFYFSHSGWYFLCKKNCELHAGEKKNYKTAADFMLSDLVPAPRHLTLERQLNKSVLIGWNPTDQYGNHQIESYHVYVDGNLKVTVKAAERTRALVEGVDCNRVNYNLIRHKIPIIMSIFSFHLLAYF